MAASRPSPPTAPPDVHDDAPRTARGVAVTVAAVVLAIAVLAGLPAGAAPNAGAKTSAVATTTTTTPKGGSGAHSTSSSTTTTSLAPVIKVAVLTPTGAPDESAVHAKLAAAGYDLTDGETIPDSWVSTLTAPSIQYPPGYTSEALKVAVTLDLPVSDVTAEVASNSVGSDVIEVFVPANSTTI